MALDLKQLRECVKEYSVTAEILDRAIAAEAIADAARAYIQADLDYLTTLPGPDKDEAEALRDRTKRDLSFAVYAHKEP